MSRRLVRNVTIFVVSMAAGGVFFWAVTRPTEVLHTEDAPVGPPISEIPSFELESAYGGTIGRDDLLGKFWIADLIYTNCSAQCPMMTRRMNRLQETIAGADGDDVRLVSISVDPRNDSAAILRDYASKERANPKRWYFLRGDEAVVRRLAVEGFKVPWGPDDPLQHAQYFVLVDPKGRVRGLYDATDDAKIERLQHDLAWLREHEPADTAKPAPTPNDS